MLDANRPRYTRRQILQLIGGGLGLISMPAFAGSRWSRAASLPLAVQEIYPTAHQNRVWVAGGIASGSLAPFFSKHVFSYSPGEDRWREESALPEARHHVALASSGDALYAIGGFLGEMDGVWQMRDTVCRLDDAKWKPVRALPERKAEGVVLVHDDRIHVIGGQHPKAKANRRRNDHTETGAHFVYDPTEDRWDNAAPLPTLRNSATGGIVAKALHIVGGRTAKGNLTAHERYDPRADRWESRAPLPKPQAGLAGAVAKGRLHVFGGEIFSPRQAVFPDAWAYTQASDRWDAIESMPTPRHGLGAVALSGKIFVVGGATRPGASGRSDVNEVFAP